MNSILKAVHQAALLAGAGCSVAMLQWRDYFKSLLSRRSFSGYIYRYIRLGFVTIHLVAILDYTIIILGGYMVSEKEAVQPLFRCFKTALNKIFTLIMKVHVGCRRNLKRETEMVH